MDGAFYLFIYLFKLYHFIFKISLNSVLTGKDPSVWEKKIVKDPTQNRITIDRKLYVQRRDS